jgi:nitrite reductase (NADH) small subunit
MSAGAATAAATALDDVTRPNDGERAWQPICRVDDIPVLGARRVRRARGADVALFRAADGTVFALLDRCPHKGGPLSQGIVFGRSVACPLHNWTVALDDGHARAPDEGCTPSFSVRIEGDAVLLDTEELATRAVNEEPPCGAGAHPGC